MVNSALESCGDQISLAGICQEISELRPYLNRMTTQAVVVDIDSNPSRILRDLDFAVSTHPEMRVVVVSSSFSHELLLQTMQAGARHFLEKGDIKAKLAKIMQQLVSWGAERTDHPGFIITLFSASGGCGATTAALNIANELRLISSGRILTIDLDSHYGAISAFLGTPIRYGIADVLAQKEQLDEHLIETTAMRYMDDFHVLASPAAAESPLSEPVRYENLVDVLEICRKTYRYTVIDAPRVEHKVAASLAAVSDLALIAFQLTVKDIHFARSIMSDLTADGMDPEKIVPLANRFKKRTFSVRRKFSVALDDSRKALGKDRVFCVRSDWLKAVDCANRGQLLAQGAPKSGLRRDFQKLAVEIYEHTTNSNGKTIR